MKKMFICLLIVLLTVGGALAQEDYPDGIYRGFYYDGNIEQLSIQFELKDGLFVSFNYRGVRYKDGNYMSRDASDAQKATLGQYYQLADHLIGKGIDAIDDLYAPYSFVQDADSVTSATIQSSKLISAIWDGLNRHPFKLVDTTKLQTASSFADGLYRGQYMDLGVEQVTIEFILRDGIISEAYFTMLQYDGCDYLAAEQTTLPVRTQFEQLLSYLVGKPVSAVNDLYIPENIASDIDTYTAATLRSPKVISAIWDGLGRHAYRIDINR